MIHRTFPKYLLIATMSPLFFNGCTAMVATSAATGIMVAQDRRTTGTIIEDKSIEVKAKKLVNDITSKVDNIHVSFSSYNGNVLITGQAPSRSLSDKIEYAVQKIPKVGQVFNEIALATPNSFVDRARDAWISTRVKSDMVINNRINPTRVKVTTVDGIVYLMGIIDKSEEQQAVDIARHTKGVKKVVKIFEYLPS